MDHDVTWNGGRCNVECHPYLTQRGPGHIALDGDPAPPWKGYSSPLFSAHVYCDQTIAHLSYCWALVYVCLQHSIIHVTRWCNSCENAAAFDCSYLYNREAIGKISGTLQLTRSSYKVFEYYWNIWIFPRILFFEWISGLVVCVSLTQIGWSQMRTTSVDRRRFTVVS